MAEVDQTMAFKLTPSLLEQLGKALMELEAHKDSSPDPVSFTEITQHFRDLESKMMKKYSELEAKEKSFKQEESDTRSSLAAKEAAVTQKEQDMFDRIQILKDAAVSAITEARATHLPPPVYTNADIIDDTENIDTNNKVINSPSETDGIGNDDGEAVSFHHELTRFCDEMDSRGLVSFVIENRKNITVLCEELSDALKCSPEPGRLILGALEGFYPNPNPDDPVVLRGMRQSCIDVMEALNAMLAKGEMGADALLGLEIKQQAKAIADEWRPKLGSHDNNDNKSLEAEAFLQLLATFRIASEFDEDELCKLIHSVCERRQAPQLCRGLGLAHKMPGVIEELVSNGKLISAVHFVHAFELADRFPTVPLLKTYLKDLRRSSQGKRGNWGNSDSGQNEGNAKELAALKAVIYCVQKYDLETEYPLEAIHRRLEQLERAKVDRKRSRDPPTKHHHNKKPRPKGGNTYGHRHHGGGSSAGNGRQPPHSLYLDRGHYSAPAAERYPQVDPYYQAAAPPQPPPTQAGYSQQVYEQSAYYYPPPDAAAAAPPAAAYYTSTGAPVSYQPYMYQ